MKRTILILFALALFAQCGFAAGEYLFYPVESTNWSNGNNWYVDGVPGATPGPGSLAVISDYTGWAADAVLDAPGTADMLYLGFGGSGSLDVQSALTMTSYLYTGVTSGTGALTVSTGGSINTPRLDIGFTSSGTMTMNDGSVTASAWLIVGNAADGLLTMTGGLIDTAELYIGQGSTGHIDLDGGVLTAGYLGFDMAGGVGSLDLGGDGKLVLTNAYFSPDAWLPVVEGLIGAGTITNAQANIVGNTLEITVIPEPATLALLSLGFGLIRRKRS